MENLQRQLESLRRWKWLILVVVLLSVVSAVAISTSQSSDYTAKATLLYGSTALANNNLSPDQNAVQARGVIDNLNGPLGPGIRAGAKIPKGVGINASQVAASSYIRVAATAGSAQRAIDAANAFVNEYVRQNDAAFDANQKRQTATLKAQLAQASADEERYNQALVLAHRSLASNTEAAGKFNVAHAEVQRLSSLISSSTQNPNPISVQASATDATRNSPHVFTNGVLGLIGGLVLGGALALLLGALDLRLRSPVDVKEQLGLPTLASIAGGRGRAVEGQRVEDFKTLANALAARDARVGSIAVTSPGDGDGKSMVATNIARYRAAQGDRVILIEADMRNGGHGVEGNGAGGSLAEILSGDRAIAIDRVLSPTDQANLLVLHSGSSTGDPYPLFNSERMRKLLQQARAQSDLVVIDAPSLLRAAESQAIAGRVDGTVLVLDAVNTQTKAAKDARDLLARVNANILGVVLNRVTKSTTTF